MIQPALVAFDLDGTLIDTAPEIGDAVNDTLTRLGLAAMLPDRVIGWIGHGTRELLIQAMAAARRVDAARVRPSRELAEAYAQFEHDYLLRCGTRSRPYDGAVALLQALRAQGVRTCVVTNKETRFTERVLAAHGLGAWLDRVVCGDTLPTRKPDPAGLLGCLSAFGIDPARALFVGDSSIDAATARAAGVPVWLLTHGYNMGRPVSDSAPDAVFDGFALLHQAWDDLRAVPATD